MNSHSEFVKRSEDERAAEKLHYVQDTGASCHVNISEVTFCIDIFKGIIHVYKIHLLTLMLF